VLADGTLRIRCGADGGRLPATGKIKTFLRASRHLSRNRLGAFFLDSVASGIAPYPIEEWK